jgi:hypothetical protein
MISNLISPSGEPSLQDNLWHIASSDNSGSTDMKYIFDVYKGSEQLVRVKVFPDPTNGKGYFDASPIVRNEVTYEWFVPDNNGVILATPSQSGEVALTYSIRVGEDVSGVMTTNLASGNVKAFNYVPSLFKRRKLDFTQYNNKWLTNRPNYAKLTLTEKLMIGVKTTGILDLLVETYGYNNSLIDSEDIGVGVNGIQQLDISPSAINNEFSGLIDSNVAYYTITDLNNNLSKFKVYLDCSPIYTPINLHFMNACGVFDTARFKLASKLTMDLERKSFEKQDYRFGSSSVGYYNSKNVYYESKINYGSKAMWSYNLTMDYPTDAEYQWLAELITSPLIYMELDGNYYPVTIKDTNYEYSTYNTNKLKVLNVNIDVNQKRYGYRR